MAQNNGQANGQANSLALMKRDVVDVVNSKVQAFVQRGELHLPANYSVENAMKSAWLILQTVEDKEHKLALTTCTRDSVANALLDMAVQGLNPAKKQCYFIAYGKQLTCQRSYFGTMAVAKLVDGRIEDIFAEVVYEGDTFKYAINRGRKEIIEHCQGLENVDSKKVKGAYCIVVDHDGQAIRTEIMTFDEIKQAWRQSKMYPIDSQGAVKADSTHGKYTAEMCKKTVINKCCKPIINSSADGHLLRSFNRADDERAEEDAAAEIEANANSGEIIDVQATPVEDISETTVVHAPAEAQQQQTLAGAAAGPGF